MIDMKEWYRSKTVWGALVAIASAVLRIFGHEIAEDDQIALVDALLTLGGAMGGLLALYGRLAAKTGIGKS